MKQIPTPNPSEEGISKAGVLKNAVFVTELLPKRHEKLPFPEGREVGGGSESVATLISVNLLHINIKPKQTGCYYGKVNPYFIN